MSRKCDHDWFDHYMMYNMMSNGGGKALVKRSGF